MASVRSTIDLVITGATRGLAAASAEAEAMAERVGRAEDRVSAARTRSAAAEERVGVAEARLNAARQQQEAALSRIGVAETNLERVRATANEGATRLSQAEADLARIRANGGSAQEVEQAERRVTQVRQQSDLASRRLQQAEAQLASARANANRASSNVGAAEAALARARSDAVRASEGAARAEEDLNNLRRRGNRDVEDQRSGLLGLFDAFSRLGNALTGADDAANRFLSVGAALQNLFSTIGGPIIQTVFGIIQLIALFGALGEIVGVVGGVLGQALAGVPALLFAIVAAGGVVLLAFQDFGAAVDGTGKKMDAALAKLAPNAREAALVFRNDLKPALHDLQQAVQNAFFEGMAQRFRELAAIVPLLTPGLRGVATAVSGVLKNLIDLVAIGTNGLRNLQTAIGGAEAFVRGLTLGLTTFITGFLNAAAAAAPVMNRLGEALGSVLGKIGDVFNRLAENGTIQKAVTGLAATIEGLGAVLAPIIELLIRMGAALGTTFGGALTRIGAIINDSIPFFEHLALVAGDLLVTAFNEIGPAIQNFIGNGLGPAQSGMDQFASFVKSTIIPAIRDFINFLANDGITAIRNFALGLVAQLTSAASGVLALVDGMLAALRDLFVFLAVQTGDQKFLAMAQAAEQARLGVDKLKTTIDGLHDKSVQVLAQGADTSFTAVKNLGGAIEILHDRTVATVSTVGGTAEVKALVDRQAEVQNKTVATVSNVPSGPTLGTLGNQTLTGAIGAVINKTVTTIGDVPGSPTRGTFGNQALKGAIDQVNGKTVTVNANVNGTGAVQALVSAINQVHSATATVTTYIRQITQQFAKGGQAPGGVPILVGEQGPEMIVLPRGGGFVYTAAQTQAMLNSTANNGTGGATQLGTGGPDPVTVTVNLSQEAIAGIAEVVITRRDRQTKRTVFAGSGVTV